MATMMTEKGLMIISSEFDHAEMLVTIILACMGKKKGVSGVFGGFHRDRP